MCNSTIDWSTVTKISARPLAVFTPRIEQLNRKPKEILFLGNKIPIPSEINRLPLGPRNMLLLYNVFNTFA